MSSTPSSIENTLVLISSSICFNPFRASSASLASINPACCSILTCAMVPVTSCSASSTSNSLSRPTVNFSICSDVSVLLLLQSFIVQGFNKEHSSVIQYTAQFLPQFP